jgi:hypothetical protein
LLRKAVETVARVQERLGRERPACTVYATSYCEHLLQIYAGLYALHEAGVIRVRQRFGREALRRRLGGLADARLLAPEAGALVVDIEDAGLAFFDVRDDAGGWMALSDRLLVYAKRSFRPGRFPGPATFLPLGLNYAVSLERSAGLELVRCLVQLDRSSLARKRLLVALARTIPGVGRALGIPTVASVGLPPDAGAPPRAIFLARTWQEREVRNTEEVGPLNDMRAGCIRALRARFGERFLGGFAPSEHARAAYPDCVVGADVSTRRSRYLRLLKAYPVCVATRGLSGSIGWKFAEYVALSKSIVSEPTRIELPGPIAAGENYLEFETPEACVQRVAELMENAGVRLRMMEKNREYHLEYGTPWAIVARVLDAAMAAAGAYGEGEAPSPSRRAMRRRALESRSIHGGMR